MLLLALAAALPFALVLPLEGFPTDLPCNRPPSALGAPPVEDSGSALERGLRRSFRKDWKGGGKDRPRNARDGMDGGEVKGLCNEEYENRVRKSKHTEPRQH